MAPKKSRNTEELPKYTKSTDRRARHRCRFGLPLGRSLDYWRRLEPYWPWNYCRCPFLVLLKHFAVLVLLCLQILAKKKTAWKEQNTKKFTHWPLPNTTPLTPLFPKVWTITLSPTGSFKLLTLSWKNILSVFQCLTEVYSPFSKLSTTIS